MLAALLKSNFQVFSTAWRHTLGVVFGENKAVTLVPNSTLDSTLGGYGWLRWLGMITPILTAQNHLFRVNKATASHGFVE